MTGRYPRQFGKYVLLKPLAKGGMGEIYLAAGGDVGGFEKLCVIKKVITEKADRAKAKRFLDEAKVVLRLSHSALVTTFDAGDVNGEFYIAMELVEGKDLREVWNRCVRIRQRIPLDVALHVVREVARALAYVHGYGELKLVHRDVAPPNILLAYVGDVKLTDFGLARSVLKQEHTAPGVVFGRAAYLAPEQARGEVADARTDVYTLGIVLWELLTGQQFLQLGGLDPAAALTIVRNPRLAPPSTRAPWISPALDQVVVRALAADRLQRYQTADELRSALGEVISDIAPRAEANRVAEFLRTIYSETIDEERIERERFLKEVIPQFRIAPGYPDGLVGPGPAGEGAAHAPTAGPAATEGGAGAPGAGEPNVAGRSSSATHPLADLAGPAPGSGVPGPRPPTPAGGVPGPRPPTPAGGVPGPRPPTPAGGVPVRGATNPLPLRLPGLPPTPPALPPLAPLAPRNGAPLRPPSRPGIRTPSEVPLRQHDSADSAESAPPPPAPEAKPPASSPEIKPVSVPAESKPPASGRLVAGYRLLRPIGVNRLGGMHRAVRPGSSEELSLRLLEVRRPVDAAALERLREDARRLARLKHPNIAVPSELGVADDGSLFAILEPLAGADLATLMREERRFEGGQALDIARQIARGLAAAHAAGVLHLALEPERVLIGTDEGMDQVRVLDFGVGSLGDLRPPGAPRADALTVLYRAPEQVGPRPGDPAVPVDARADVYALAVLLYEMVTGAPPHASSPDPGARKLKEAVQSPRMFRPEVPLELERLLMASLDRDPARRPQTMAAFEDALASMARPAGAAASPAPATRHPRPEDDDQARRLARREAAFRVIGDLLAASPAPASAAGPQFVGLPSGAAASRPGSDPASHPGASPDVESSSVSSPGFGGAMLDRYGASPEQRAGRERRVAVALVVVGVLAIAAAVAWRFLG